MNLLLDTHVLLWYLATPEKLRPSTYAAIRSLDNRVYISAATVWEIAIKKALGKLDCPDDLLEQIAARDEFLEIIEITAEDAWTAGHLPRHHEDPFDRMIIAHATIGGMTIVTRDDQFHHYDAPLMEP